MTITQISVFLENQSGRLSEVADIIGKNKINLRALSLADTHDFGILRLIVDQPEEAFVVLKAAEFTVAKTEMVAIEVSDHPGGLARILGVIKEQGLSIEYMYAYLQHRVDTAILIFRFENTEDALKKLCAANLPVLDGKHLLGIADN